MTTPVPVPEGSSLQAYVHRGAFADCYATPLSGTVTLPELVEAFYTTRLFKVERWLLAKALGLQATDEQARQLACGSRDRFSAWRVEHRSPTEILLDAGQTRSWLSVQTQPHAPPAQPHASAHAPAPAPPLAQASTTLLFGSAVVPLRPGGQFGWAFHALLGFHQLYSRLLLASAARRVVALRKIRTAR